MTKRVVTLEQLTELRKNFKKAQAVRLCSEAVELLQNRADNYRLFMPEWPALWQSFEREAAAMRAKRSTT